MNTAPKYMNDFFSGLKEDILKIVEEAAESVLIDQQRPLNSKEAAEFLRISVSTLQRRVDEGTIRPSIIGNRKLFRKADLVASLKNSK